MQILETLRHALPLSVSITFAGITMNWDIVASESEGDELEFEPDDEELSESAPGAILTEILASDPPAEAGMTMGFCARSDPD